MDRKLEEGFDKLSAATFAYTSTAFPMLTGTLITVAGFIPVGLRAEPGRRVRQRSLFWVTGISLVLSWFAAVYFTPWIGYRLLQGRKARAAGASSDVYDSRCLSRDPARRALVRAAPPDGRRADRRRASWPASPASRFIPQQFFPTSEPPGDPGGSVAAGGRLVRRDRARGQAARAAAAEGPRPARTSRPSSARARRASTCRSISSSGTRTSPSCS